MSIALNSFNPNTQIESAKVNTNFTNVKNGVEDSSYRAFSWGIIGGVAVLDEQGMKWIVPQNLTIKKLWTKTGSGTCTVRIQKNTTDIHAGFASTSTIDSTTTFASTTVTEGQLITLDVTAASSCVDLYVLLECQVTTIA